MGYLNSGANAIGELLKFKKGDITYDPDNLEFILSTTCITLTKLEKDTRVENIIRELPQGEKAQSILNQINNFTEEFLALDKALLIESGMNPHVANFLFSDFEKAQNIITNPEGFSYDKFQLIINDLRYFACDYTYSTSPRDVTYDLEGILYFVGGAAIMVTNYTYSGLIPVISEASKLLGGHLMAKGSLS